jgi:hypothetical protein
MNAYKCEKGYLLGMGLGIKCKIDNPNIIFININNLREKYYPEWRM